MPRNIFQVTVNNVNNNEVFNPYVFVRNRLYHFVFHRFALVYARILSDAHRKLLEFLILLASLFCFITLIYVHVVFVQTPVTCLDNYKDVWQRNGILRVEVLSGKKKENYTLQDSYWKEKTLRLQHFDGQSYYFYSEQAVKEESTSKDMTREEVIIIGSNLSMKEDIPGEEVSDNLTLVEPNESKESEEDSANESESEKVKEETTLQPILAETIIATDPDGAYIMEFSLEYGFLRLRPSKRRDLNISVTFVVLDPEVDECFGGSFNRFLLDNFLGYDNVLLASMRTMAEKKDQKGFVRNVVTDIEYIFVNSWSSEKSYITAGFVMIIFTLTISTLLRHSHHQIFIVVGFWMNYVIATFGRPRVNLWPRNLIPSSGAPVLTVILALVGMEAVMSDFFHDRSIALYVIVIVWFADLYDAVCCQSALSKRHWFRFFYLYHFLFYAYNYKFGGVYWPLTLTTSWMFTLHSMIFFFHHYELPRFLHRAARVTAAHEAARNPRPRQNPPDDPPTPNQEPDRQPGDNPPDHNSNGHSNGGNESTPEPDNDQESAGNDRELSVDRSDSTDQSVSTDLSGFENHLGATEPSRFNNHSGATELSGFNNQSGPTELSGFQHNQLGHHGQSGFANSSNLADHSLPSGQGNSVNRKKSMKVSESLHGSCNDQFSSKCLTSFTESLAGSSNQLDSTNHFGFKNPSSSIDGIQYKGALGSIDQSNFRNPGMQYDSINSINQSKYLVESVYTSFDNNLSIKSFNSLKESKLANSFQTKDQNISNCKEASLVQKSGMPICHDGILPCNQENQSDFKDWDCSIPYLSKVSQSQVYTRSPKAFKRHELERFYKLAHRIYGKNQSNENVLVAKKCFADALFLASYLKTNSSCFREKTSLCFNMKQSLGVNVG